MNITIRHEETGDYAQIKETYSKAFGRDDENKTLEELRLYANYITELSLVAEVNNKIVGHAVFYPVRIVKGAIKYASLSLLPVGVHPEYEDKGVSKMLINAGLEIAEKKDCTSVLTMGDPDFFSEFGFEPACNRDITCPFDIPSDFFMVHEIKATGGLAGISGMVEFPKELSTGMNN